MKKIIRWGILGTGNIANSFAEDFKFVQNGKIIAAASRTLEKAEAFTKKHGIRKAYGSYEELFKDEEIDVVYVATPHNLHFKNSCDAMLNGKAVLCEKPITTSAADLKILMRTAEATGMYFMEAMWTYFLPPILQAKHWAESGKIGKIRYIKADFGFKADPENKRLFDPDLAGGSLLDIGIYPIALASLIYKQQPIDISVQCQKASTGVDVGETIIAKYPNDTFANLSASFLFDMPNDALIVGDSGYITIPNFFMAKECFLFKDKKQVDYFKDDSKCVGYNYETERVNRDLIEGKTQSDIMPWTKSMLLQEFMDKVKRNFKTKG